MADAKHGTPTPKLWDQTRLNYEHYWKLEQGCSIHRQPLRSNNLRGIVLVEALVKPLLLTGLEVGTE
eukprot:scaffold25389_cov71-Cyclotella_meneghiniana.AAC.12